MSILLAFLYRVPAVLVAVLLHGYAQQAALTAAPLRLVRERGARKPLSLIDPLGAVLLLVTGYGWGNPVGAASVYPLGRRGRLAAAHIFPLACNIAVGMCLIVCYGALNRIDAPEHLLAVIREMGWLNVAFGLFHIVPIPPLDGARVLSLYLSAAGQLAFRRMEWALQAVLAIAIVSGFAARLFDPVVSVLFRFAAR